MDYKNDLFFGKRRYNMISNSDGTVSLEDVTVYQQVGDSFGAGDMNKLASVANGFEAKTTVFNEDGSITEVDSNGYIKKTVFNEDGSIAETIEDADGNILATKTTTFNEDGSISEVVI